MSHILSRRSLILGTGAAIITRRASALTQPLLIPYRNNPLAFPAGIPAGFNPKHFAASKKFTDSGVVVPGSKVAINLVTGLVGVVGGTAASIAAVETDFGPGLTFGDLTHVTNSDLGTRAATGAAPTAVTYAAILIWGGTSVAFPAPLIVYGYNGAVTQGLSNGGGPPAQLAMEFGNTGTNWIFSGISLPVTTWMFIAASYNGANANFVVRSIGTGSPAITSTTAGVKSIASAPRTIFGGFGSVSNNCNATIHAVMAAENNYLSQAQLALWADRPWDFWYPPLESSVVGQTLAQGTGGTGALRQRTMMGEGL